MVHRANHGGMGGAPAIGDAGPAGLFGDHHRDQPRALIATCPVAPDRRWSG
jgi:hypothetical protein